MEALGSGSKRRRVKPKEEQEELLEALLFGDVKSRVTRTQQLPEQASAAAADLINQSEVPPQITPAWVDDDDGNVEVNIQRIPRLRKLRSDPNDDKAVVSGNELEELLQERFQPADVAWADLDASKKSALLNIGADATPFLARSSQTLLPGKIHVVRCPDANICEPAQKAVTSLSFHSEGLLLAVGSEDKRLRMFSVDGDKNSKILTLAINDMPIKALSFIGSSGELLMAGRRPFFRSYDLESGEIRKIHSIVPDTLKTYELFTCSDDGSKIALAGVGGCVHILCGKRKQSIGSVTMNTPARAVSFGDTSSVLITSGLNADVYVWDIRHSSRCLQRFKHEDGSCTKALACSSHFGGCIGVAGESGVVSIYATGKGEERLTRVPTHMKSLMNLTTEIDTLTFSNDGQILAMASSDKVDALRLVHLPTCTVFQNWPTERTPLKRVTDVKFSPGGGYVAISNKAGRVLLYRLTHYPVA